MTDNYLRPELEGAQSFYAPTLMETPEWKAMVKRENTAGPEPLLAELLEQPILSVIEMLWITRTMLTYYGKKNSRLKKVPAERLLKNTSSLLRILVLLLDLKGEIPDENMRAYITVRLRDACWGLTEPTRKYLDLF